MAIGQTIRHFAFALIVFIGALDTRAQPIEDLIRAANGGEAEAQFKLGLAYDRGDGVLPNIATALEWYRKAAAQDHAEANHYIALTYDFADRVEEDDYEAFLWYSRAAELEWGPAQIALGINYQLGDGVSPDATRARFWFEQAIKNGEADGYGHLADLYFRGIGTRRDQQKAIELLEEGALAGSLFSQRELSKILLFGPDDLKNRAQGLAWLLVAEESANDEDERSDVRALIEQAGATESELLWARRLAVMRLGALGAQLTQDQSEAFDTTEQQVLTTIQKGLTSLEYFDGEIDGATSEELDEAIEAFSKDWNFDESDQSKADLVLRIGAAIAFNVMQYDDGETDENNIGSGFVVSASGQIVTNAHVVEDCTELRLRDGTVIEVQATDDASDLALLSGANTIGDALLPMRAGIGPRVGDRVWIAGFPLSGYLTSDLNVAEGTVMALSGPGQDRREFQFSAPVQPGNSGGPILDTSGRLVGVVVSGLDALRIAAATGDLPENVNFGVALGTLQSFLDTHTVDYDYLIDAPVLDGPAIAERASRSTVALYCD